MLHYGKQQGLAFSSEANEPTEITRIFKAICDYTHIVFIL